MLQRMAGARARRNQKVAKGGKADAGSGREGGGRTCGSSGYFTGDGDGGGGGERLEKNRVDAVHELSSVDIRSTPSSRRMRSSIASLKEETVRRGVRAS